MEDAMLLFFGGIAAALLLAVFLVFVSSRVYHKYLSYKHVKIFGGFKSVKK